jgi:HEAT repeat protein
MPRRVTTLTNQNKSVVGVNIPVKQNPMGDESVIKLVRQLQSENEVERGEAKEGLRSLARKSRQQIVNELIKLMEGSEPKLRITSQAHYDAWSFAAELLGELKATEALDVLIACISCNNGIHGLSAYRFPAFRALITIGPEAVPRLISALSDSNASTRSRAALALGEIGGTDATKALENALVSERNQDVVISIQIALRNR